MSKDSAIASIRNSIEDREDNFDELISLLFNYFNGKELEEFAEYVYDETHN